MTPPPTPLTDEQRIASLEAQLVTMREALQDSKHLHHAVCYCRKNSCDECSERSRKQYNKARSALSASADYANKVMVDKKQLDKVCADLSCARTTERIDSARRWILDAYNRLDSLRKGGGG